ncbi:HAD family hydrolase [Stigmatella aurantiaca]|uniref:Haloacid dehydrogenase/epoxide hydrolase n=2 Tax=Stigmatella aurantiaca (strain DW4/3-1) TaxID=378806 RepID=E3FVZ8_STIAD|nr:HAD family phosphatase [Stigmatella aurantiaca]ADO74719.1 Haloacid dehydrogenase/epoxide hydrolase [Stigmatella aurantiaca DW4/3-1]
MPVDTVSAVMFDMDGVLIDTHHAVAALWTEIARGHGKHLTEEDIRRYVLGRSPEHTVTALFAELEGESREHLLNQVRQAEPRLNFSGIAGTQALVERLAAAGVPLALVTSGSKTRVQRVLAALGLAPSFRVCVTWEDIQNGKPAPDCYLLGAKRLGIPADRCLVVEDAPSGIAAGNAAGAVCLGLTTGDGADLRERGARYVVQDLADVECRAKPGGLELVFQGNVLITIGKED